MKKSENKKPEPVLIRVPKQTVVCSFSGGETSAMMVIKMLEENKAKVESEKRTILIPFMNTGEEREETLLFVHQVDQYINKEFGANVVWLEYNGFDWEKGRHKYKKIDYHSAYRSHDPTEILLKWPNHPFRKMIEYFGIPNQKYKHCTRELKARTCRRWLNKEYGLREEDYTIATGIRADEIDRFTSTTWHPLAIQGIIKPMVNTYWSLMPFRLQLKGYEGNCKVCYKKSNRKLCTIAKYNPEHFGFFDQMDLEFSLLIPERKGNKPKRQELTDPVRFFRGNLTAKEVIEKSKEPFEEADDDSTVYVEGWDDNGECSESCEPF